MKKLFKSLGTALTLTLIWLFVSCNHVEEGEYLIKGTISNAPDSAELTISFAYKDGSQRTYPDLVDTIIDGKFEFKGKLNKNIDYIEINNLTYNLTNGKVRMYVDDFKLYAHIKGDGHVVSSWTYKGNNPRSIEYQNYIKSGFPEALKLEENKWKMGNIETVIGKNRSSEVRYKAQLSLKKENDKLDSIIDKKHLEHLKGTPVTESWLKNLVRIAMSAKYTKNPSINDVLEVYNVIPEEFKNLEITQKIDVMLHPPKVINVGDSMAVTTLYDVNGGSHELSEFKGKYIFFDFWSRFCGYCDPTNPGIKKVKDTYKDNLVVIGINVDNKTIWQEELKKYNIVDDKYGYQFNELNGEQFLYNSYNFKGYPSFALVSDEGKLLTKWSGIPIDDDFVSKISKFLP